MISDGFHQLLVKMAHYVLFLVELIHFWLKNYELDLFTTCSLNYKI